MAGITAAQVKSLRELTSLPMMECKAALVDADGDAEQAKLILQKKYKGKMGARAENVTAEGRVGLYISDNKDTGAIVQLQCETAPVAKTDQFIELADLIARAVATQSDSHPSAETVRTFPSPRGNGKTLADEITEVFGLVRENLKLTECRKIAGAHLCGYVHHDGKSGVLIALDATPNPESAGTDLCHHVTFANPLAVTRDDVPADEVEKVRQLARELAESEGKPAQIIDKIVNGKVNAFYAENALMEQEHVKVSKTKVGDVLQAAGVSAVTDLARMKLG
jgi:elongation factor Ts